VSSRTARNQRLILLALGTSFVLVGSLLSYGAVQVFDLPHGEFAVIATFVLSSIFVGWELWERRPAGTS
jgi:branched-subunit amino acid ABC-type transport system permease component